MRISGGTAKGRRTATQRILTKTSTGERLRPTSAKVREALFDILRNRIEGAVFVDLYAGTGTVGLEALSRGAGKAIFVEPDDLRTDSIRNTVREFGFQDKTLIVKGRADEFLRKASAGKELFDIFFLDPPYGSEDIEKILPLIGRGEMLHQEGIVVVEHYFKKKMPEISGYLKRNRNYRYGDTMLTLYRKAEI